MAKSSCALFVPNLFCTLCLYWINHLLRTIDIFKYIDQYQWQVLLGISVGTKLSEGYFYLLFPHPQVSHGKHLVSLYLWLLVCCQLDRSLIFQKRLFHIPVFWKITEIGCRFNTCQYLSKINLGSISKCFPRAH